MKSDSKLMAVIVAGGAVAVIGALVMISRAKATSAASLQGLGAAITFQPASTVRRGATRAIRTVSTNRVQQLRGWGSYGTPGFGRGYSGTASTIFWRRA